MTKSDKRKYVSDIIGDDYKKWTNDYIILDCATGSGKTFFCINVLGKYAESNGKKILYLCNRTRLRNQVFRQVDIMNLRDTICVKSYQSLRQDLQNGNKMQQYSYIIADECHYFTGDASFNSFTDISYDFVMNQKNRTVILVSATAKSFFDRLQKENIVDEKNVYCLTKDYSYVKRLYYYRKNELTNIIDGILSNEGEKKAESKIVVFCNSGDRVLDMYRIYGEQADYYCSMHAKDNILRRICGWSDETKENKCIEKKSDGLVTFKKRILFTTSALDNGIDLKDRRIKHIFSELINVDTMIQAFGRKRSLDESDTCCFYIREYQSKGLQGFINRIEYQLKPVNMYMENYPEFYLEYGNGQGRDILCKNRIFFNVFSEDNSFDKIRVNERRYEKYKQDLKMFSQMKEMGYRQYIESVIDKSLVEKSEEMGCSVDLLDTFMTFLHGIEGEHIYRDDQKRIKAQFEKIGVKLRYTGINTFNGALDDNYGGLYLCRFYNKSVDGKSYVDKKRKLDDGSDNPNRDKRYWILENRSS